MNQGCSRLGPRRGAPAVDARCVIDWARQAAALVGRCEEYQSSVIALPRLHAALRRKPDLVPVLQAPLAELQDTQRSLRYEVLGLLDDFAALVEGTLAPGGEG